MFDEIKTPAKLERPDLKISGAGSAAGGSFNEVKISGAGEINGDIECNEMKTSGASKIKGNVKAKDIGTSGMSKITGNVEAESITTSGTSEITGDVFAGEVKTSGSTKIDGNLKVGEMKISGSANIGGNVHAEEIKVSGAVNIGGDCEAERFIASGGFKIGGLLNGDEIDINISGNCRVREIGGERIKVEKRSRDIFGLERIIRAIFLCKGELTADTIEGDEINLENTRAKIVRGNNVTIGQDCEIETVEYSGKLEIVDGAKVINQKKL